MIEAWQQEYEGGALDNFLEAIEWYESNYQPKIHYGRTISILQSSGTGKSRLVDQLASVVRPAVFGDLCQDVMKTLNVGVPQHPVLSVVLRKTDDVTEGWPPRDRPVLKFFEYYSKDDDTVPLRVREIRVSGFYSFV